MDFSARAYHRILKVSRTIAEDVYKRQVFEIKGVSDYHSLEQELGRKMHKAIAMIQFKLEGQLLRERREFHMEDRCLLHRIDPEKGSIVMPVSYTHLKL